MKRKIIKKKKNCYWFLVKTLCFLISKWLVWQGWSSSIHFKKIKRYCLIISRLGIFILLPMRQWRSQTMWTLCLGLNRAGMRMSLKSTYKNLLNSHPRLSTCFLLLKCLGWNLLMWIETLLRWKLICTDVNTSLARLYARIARRPSIIKVSARGIVEKTKESLFFGW